jgi:hypothetical protein
MGGSWMKDITIGRASHTRRARDSIARCLGLKDDDAQCGGLAGYLYGPKAENSRSLQIRVSS